MRPRLPAAVLLALAPACAGAPVADAPVPAALLTAEAAAARAVVDAVDPLPLLAFPEVLLAALPPGGDCPLVREDGGIVTWTGGCTSADGRFTIDGELQSSTGEGRRWVAGEGFAVRAGGAALVQLDGAIEEEQQGEVVLLDASATWCGGAAPCAEGPRTVDLSFTLLPAAAAPERFDGTVMGAVGLLDGVVTVEGAWRGAACGLEADHGLFAFGGALRHTLVWEGRAACDACADWTVEGLAAPPLCADTP